MDNTIKKKSGQPSKAVKYPNERLNMATKNVDVLFHAAAMKQVDTIEYNPIEAIKTNINGTENIVKVVSVCNNFLISIISILHDYYYHLTI